MTDCKNCLHYEVCADVMKKELFIKEKMLKIANPICKCFLDKSKIIELPCKVGDTVYRITQCSCEDIDGEQTEAECPYKLRVVGCNVTEMNIFMFAREWESATFPTREEAERALKEREDNG